jgi:hypothetical protein
MCIEEVHDVYNNLFEYMKCRDSIKRIKSLRWTLLWHSLICKPFPIFLTVISDLLDKLYIIFCHFTNISVCINTEHINNEMGF